MAPTNGIPSSRVNAVIAPAAEGRTVLVSSHLMPEVAVTAQHLVVIGRGRPIADTTVDDLVALASDAAARVRSPHASDLRDPLVRNGATVTSVEPQLLEVVDLSREAAGDLAAKNSSTLHELTSHTPTLEEAFMELTHDSIDYHANTSTPVLVADRTAA